MRKFIDKYFNWLGIKNEGIRRIVLVINLIAFPFWFYFFEEILDVGNDGVGVGVILSPIWTSIVLKIISWVKQGFEKDTIYN